MTIARNTLVGLMIPMCLGLTSCGDGSVPPIDPSSPLIATVWMRQLVDVANEPVPFKPAHFGVANRIWTGECRIGLHARPLAEPLNVIGEDELGNPVQLGQKFWDDGQRHNMARLQFVRVRARHVDHTNLQQEGYLGSNFFSSRTLLRRDRARTAYGLTELAVNASVIIPNDQEPWIVRAAAHELGHQLSLDDYVGVEAHQWVMHEDIFATGENLSGWENSQATEPTAGSECARARTHGVNKYFLFYDAILSQPLP